MNGCHFLGKGNAPWKQTKFLEKCYQSLKCCTSCRPVATAERFLFRRSARTHARIKTHGLNKCAGIFLSTRPEEGLHKSVTYDTGLQHKASHTHTADKDCSPFLLVRVGFYTPGIRVCTFFGTWPHNPIDFSPYPKQFVAVRNVRSVRTITHGVTTQGSAFFTATAARTRNPFCIACKGQGKQGSGGHCTPAEEARLHLFPLAGVSVRSCPKFSPGD